MYTAAQSQSQTVLVPSDRSNTDNFAQKVEYEQRLKTAMSPPLSITNARPTLYEIILSPYKGFYSIINDDFYQIKVAKIRCRR